MGSFRDKINDKLYKAEDVEQSIKNLLAGFDELKEKDGTAKLILYPKGGRMCETIITEKTVEAFVKVFLTEYNDVLKSIIKEINEYIDGEVRTT